MKKNKFKNIVYASFAAKIAFKK